MSKNSNIQWTDSTWNIAVGCKKVDSDCKFCYMYRDSMNNTRYNPLEIRRTKTVFNMPLKLKQPSKIFTCSLTDFFIEEIDSYRNEAWDIIRKCPQHTFQILTKRPERIKYCLPEDWGNGWDNVWIGTSIGSQDSDYRIKYILSIPAKIRFLSIEPLHSKIELTSIKLYGHDDINPLKPIISDSWIESRPAIDWVIVGAESGNDNGKYKFRECKLDWIEKIVNDCKEHNVPVFVKQLGTFISKELKLKDRHGGDIEEFPEHLRIREFPIIKL